MLIRWRHQELKFSGTVDKNVRYRDVYKETCKADPATQMKILEEAWKANEKIVNRELFRILIRSINGLGMLVTDKATKLVRFIHSLCINEVVDEVIGIEGDSILSEATIIKITNEMLHQTVFDTGTINGLYDMYHGRSIYG